MKLAIKGHSTRGKEVIKLFEMLGGKNSNCLNGVTIGLYYFIEDNIIQACPNLCGSEYFIITLDEFYEKYPYKVGEKVLYLNGRKEWVEGIIDKMIWNDNNGTLTYYVNNIYGTSAGQAPTMFLRPMKQKDLKDYLKPGYVVEYNGHRCFAVVQDVHGNFFGLGVNGETGWSDLKNLPLITRVYSICAPMTLHDSGCFHDFTSVVWERKEVELTMQEIADKFGIDVNQLKIKK